MNTESVEAVEVFGVIDKSSFMGKGRPEGVGSSENGRREMEIVTRNSSFTVKGRERAGAGEEVLQEEWRTGLY